MPEMLNIAPGSSRHVPKLAAAAAKAAARVARPEERFSLGVSEPRRELGGRRSTHLVKIAIDRVRPPRLVSGSQEQIP